MDIDDNFKIENAELKQPESSFAFEQDFDSGLDMVIPTGISECESVLISLPHPGMKFDPADPSIFQFAPIEPLGARYERGEAIETDYEIFKLGPLIGNAASTNANKTRIKTTEDGKKVYVLNTDLSGEDSQYISKNLNVASALRIMSKQKTTYGDNFSSQFMQTSQIQYGKLLEGTGPMEFKGIHDKEPEN